MRNKKKVVAILTDCYSCRSSSNSNSYGRVKMPPVLWLCWLGLITFFLKMKSCCLDSMMEPIIFICEQNEVGTMNLFLAWLEIRCHTIRKKLSCLLCFNFLELIMLYLNPVAVFSPPLCLSSCGL